MNKAVTNKVTLYNTMYYAALESMKCHTCDSFLVQAIFSAMLGAPYVNLCPDYIGMVKSVVFKHTAHVIYFMLVKKSTREWGLNYFLT